jgi:hypothetical protein
MLSAEPGWVVPALSGTTGIDRVEEAPRLVLEAVSFGTADLRLIRNGITLRYRRDPHGAKGPEGSGGGAGERPWTLKGQPDPRAGHRAGRTLFPGGRGGTGARDPGGGPAGNCRAARVGGATGPVQATSTLADVGDADVLSETALPRTFGTSSRAKLGA